MARLTPSLFHHTLLLAFLCGATLTACVDSPPESPNDPNVDALEQAIINGEFDNERQAVVALFTSNSLCSGTIIKTDVAAGIGWVLTAGHCVETPIQAVIQANNFQSQSARTYNVIDQQAHPQYNSTTIDYDFAVVRIGGVTSNTPVIPVVTGSDGMGVGSDVINVGYGRTTPIGAADNNNTRRKRFNAVLNEVTPELLGASLRDGGICSGDSGGPTLATINGVETVVGVHSFGTGDCTWAGYSGRVQFVYSSWLAGVLDGEVQASCDLCRDNAFAQGGACEGVINDCFDDPDCAGLVECIQNCSTDTCAQNCGSQFSDGIDGYFAIFECGCDSCAECDNDPSCQQPETECGLQFADEACGSCNESACCNESADCAEDSVCLDCISGRRSVGCDSNNAFNNFAQCLTDSCAGPCGIEEDNGCGFSSELGDCGACLDGACCDANERCINDADCVACAQGGGSDCESNALLIDFLSCLYECDNDACGVGPIEEPTNPGTNNGTSNPGTNNGTSNPSTTDPGTTDPGTTDPGMTSGETGGDTGGFFGGGETGGSGGGAGFVGGSGGNSGPCSISNPSSAPVSPLSAIPLVALGFVSFLVRRRVRR